jgi:RhtB (resistance to homoserine/threonine) family protein
MMINQLLSVGLIMLLGAMLPGPDFAIVTKNTILHSRRTGILTALGIASAVTVHVTYCILGVAILISHSPILFSVIKYAGAAYLIYLGVQSLLTKHVPSLTNTNGESLQKTNLPDITAYRQGLFCGLLNPKATLFFLAFFTVIIKPDTPKVWELVLAIEIVSIAIIWFCSLSFFLSHPSIMRLLNSVEKYIPIVLGLFLIGFGIAITIY